MESFELWDLERVIRLVEATADSGSAQNTSGAFSGASGDGVVSFDGAPYKPNVALVVVDFLLRHGVLAPETPGYLALLKSLRSGACA